MTLTITSADPATPSITVQTSIAPIKEDVIANIEGKSTETKVAVGENATKDGTMSKIESGEHVSCDSKLGILGKVLTSTIYCVDDYMARTEILKKHRRERTPAPSWAKPHEVDYVNRKQDTPFQETTEVITKIARDPARMGFTVLREYYGTDSDTRSIKDMMQAEPDVFNKPTFFRYLELKDLPRGEKGWLRYYPSTQEKQWEELHRNIADNEFAYVTQADQPWETGTFSAYKHYDFDTVGSPAASAYGGIVQQQQQQQQQKYAPLQYEYTETSAR